MNRKDTLPTAQLVQNSFMRKIAISCVLLAFPLACQADLLPVLDITGGGFATVPLADAVGGWQFTLSQAITISALGVWDEGSDGLSINHEVGLWTAGETLLRTATVDNTSIPIASAFPDGRWLFEEITPITLAPGSYVLGAVWGDPVIGADPFRFFTTFDTVSGVSFDGSRAKTLLTAPDLVFPDEGTLPGGVFGPNMAVAIPEPATLLLVAAPLLLLGLNRRAHSASPNFRPLSIRSDGSDQDRCACQSTKC